MYNTNFVTIQVASCTKCHRDASTVSELTLSTPERSFVEASGIMSGHPANHLDGVDCLTGVTKLLAVKDAMLDDPMKYLTVASTGQFESGSYERFVAEIMRFIEDCQRYPDAKLKVS